MTAILIIDDETATLSMFRLFLGALGYQVLTASNGREGIHVFKNKCPPIVLTDIKMPGMDGLEVLKEIKSLDPDAQVIVITGHGDLELAEAAMRLHATDFIHKPIDRSALEAALKKAAARIRTVSHEDRAAD